MIVVAVITGVAVLVAVELRLRYAPRPWRDEVDENRDEAFEVLVRLSQEHGRTLDQQDASIDKLFETINELERSILVLEARQPDQIETLAAMHHESLEAIRHIVVPPEPNGAPTGDEYVDPVPFGRTEAFQADDTDPTDDFLWRERPDAATGQEPTGYPTADNPFGLPVNLERPVNPVEAAGLEVERTWKPDTP